MVRRLTRPKASLLDLSRVRLTEEQRAQRMRALRDIDAADRADAGRLERR